MATASGVSADAGKCIECGQLVYCHTACFRCKHCFHPDCLRGHSCVYKLDESMRMDYSRHKEVIYLPVEEDYLYKEISLLKQIISDKDKMIEEKDTKIALLQDNTVLLNYKIKMLESRIEMPEKYPNGDSELKSTVFNNSDPMEGTSSASSYFPAAGGSQQEDSDSNNEEDNAVGLTQPGTSHEGLDPCHQSTSIYRTRSYHPSMIIGTSRDRGSDSDISWWYVGNVSLETTASNIYSFIKRNIGGTRPKVEKLDIRSKSQCSFKIGMPRAFDRTMQDQSFWPSGIRIQRFNFTLRRRKRPVMPNRN